jgi:hypothetical protein
MSTLVLESLYLGRPLSRTSALVRVVLLVSRLKPNPLYSRDRGPSSGFSDWPAQQKKQRKKRSAIKILHPPFQITYWDF